MTVFQLKQQMDRRFDEQHVRMDAGFSSLHDKMNAILRILDDKYKHHHKILDNHEDRLKDLETRHRTTRNIPG